LPDGTPAEGAQVALATKIIGLYIKNGRDAQLRNHPTTLTSADGTFRFPPQTEPATLIAFRDRGFATMLES
jgi:hypothetical protein